MVEATNDKHVTHKGSHYQVVVGGSAFQQAYKSLKEMLEGKETMSFKREGDTSPIYTIELDHVKKGGKLETHLKQLEAQNQFKVEQRTTDPHAIMARTRLSESVHFQRMVNSSKAELHRTR